ncbi:MAG: hypothetical protein KF778_14420 [Rhodocyclaceae bacterium]|nr:hypothetical protein [Rhodocyclaceae bacterium]MBX3669591.1 hypothetical protein [Rhodocyclaceae bacterium]
MSADSVHKVSNVQVPDPILINFDTVVRRPNDADLTGGGITPVEIEIVWLSLKSVAPIDIGGTLFDVYAGLADGVDQTAGRMNLLNAAGATSGQMDIGRVGVTTDDPSAPDFLGLPVNVDILFIPAGTPGPTRADAAQTVQNVPQVFHGCAQGSPDCTGNGPSGAFSIAEPSVLVLLAAFGLVGPAVVRLRARRAA